MSLSLKYSMTLLDRLMLEKVLPRIGKCIRDDIWLGRSFLLTYKKNLLDTRYIVSDLFLYYTNHKDMESELKVILRGITCLWDKF